MRFRAALSLILFAALVTGCGSDSSSENPAMKSASSSGATAKAVTIADYTYEPADLIVPAGTTVTFTNEDSTPHTATSKQQGAFDSGSIDRGGSGSITLEKAGTFAYYCAFHPFMKGTITVE
jgi:plastocyanin